MKVLLCSYFKFPEGDAGAIRHEKFSYMLKELGCDVFVVGLGKFCEFKTQTFNEIKYTSLRHQGSGILAKVKSRLLYWSQFKRILREYKPDVVIMDDMSFITLNLKKHCKKNNIRLIHDSVEWYSAEEFRFGVFSPSFINKNILNIFTIDKSVNVISISSFLHNYYSTKGIKSVNIPIVLAQSDLCKEKHQGEVLQFMYAGQPGKKDNLDMILEAFYLLPEELNGKFKLHILGCTKEQIVASGIPVEHIEKLGNDIEIHGRVPHDEVLELLKSVDFTLLMRSPVQRYAKAGFPTKIPESLSRSTPMITNLTSDIGNYLTDGYNALIVPEYTVESMSQVIAKAISLEPEQRKLMCENAYNTASTKLQYSSFLADMNRILE